MPAELHHFKRIAHGFIPCSQSLSACSIALIQSLDVDLSASGTFGRGEDSKRPGANLRSVLQLVASFAFSRSLPLFFFALPAPPVDLLSPLSRFLPPPLFGTPSTT